MFHTRPILTCERVFLSLALLASFFFSPLAWTTLTAETNEGTPLEVAVREHNEKSKDELTVDEVVTALANWDPTKYTVPDESKRVLEEASAIFDKVASTRQLPPGSMFYTSINWTKSEDQLTEVKSTDLCLGIKSGENRMDSVVIRTEPGESRPAPADGFRWKLAPRYPKTSFASGYDFFVVRDSEDFAVRTVICALSLDKFHKDAKLVAFDQHGKRLTARGVESKGIDGITMKMFRFPIEAPSVSLIGIEEPIAR